jgi:hypothetical protein
MQKTKKKSSKVAAREADSSYFMKLVLYLIIGAQWVRLTLSNGHTQVPIPLGLFIGIAFAAHEHFRIDRKIEFAILLIAMFIGFYAQIGIFLNL